MVSIKNLAKGHLPLSQKDIEKIALSVLGKKYEASIVIGGDALLKKLNEEYRQKEGTTNVLSFSLSPQSGEIFLNEKKIAREARDAGKKIKNHFAYIFIHALLHLKGMSHGSTMEKEEKKILARFSRITN
jgi:probable rRNA maturation factor